MRVQSFFLKIWQEAKSWLLPFIVIGILYFSGLLPEVLGPIQRLVLSTGLMKPTVVEQPVLVSEAGWNLGIQSIDGSRKRLSDLKGKVIFLNQWATWCPPCVAEMPSIQKLYEKADTTQFAFVILSMDEVQDKAKRFVVRKDFTFPIFFPYTYMPTDFKSQSIPTTWIIDPKGRIVATKVGMADYDHAGFRDWFFALSHNID
jgi:thiol-disulfide isomerase/thioredoxin